MSHFDYILSLCETYGKFVLHRAALSEANVEYRNQMKRLLDWTSEKALATFLHARPEDNELRQLDLSRISNVSDSLIVSPPRQKPDLRQTPSRTGRQSYASGSELPPFLLTSFSAALIQSACVLFAEELAMGSANIDAEAIANAAVTWCRVFGEAKKETIEGAEHILESMVPAFFRLAIQLCKKASNFILFKELMITCDESTLRPEAGGLKNVISSLVHVRFGELSPFAADTIDAIVEAATHDLSSSPLDEHILDTPSDEGPLWKQQNGCISLALEVILSNKVAALAFVQSLAKDLYMVTDETSMADVFKLRCLQHCMSHCNLSPERMRIEINVDRFKEGSKMRGFVEKLFATVP